MKQKQTKSIRFTSKYLNNGKFEVLKDIDNKVKIIKNEISLYIHDNIVSYLNDPRAFKKNYTKFKIPELSAWETQTLFQDILKLYDEIVKKYISQVDLKLFSSIKTEKYKRNYKQYKKGDINTKKTKIIRKWTDLGKFIKYCIYIDFNNLEEILNNSKVKDQYLYYKSKDCWPKIKETIYRVKSKTLNKIKLIEFTTGTHRKCLSENGTTKSSYITKTNNSLYKHWFAFKLGKQRIFLPLQINKKYHKIKPTGKEFFIKVYKNKVDVITTYETEAVDFKQQAEILGMDLNVKHNFCFLSNGKEFDYNRKYIKDFVKLLKRLDKIGLKNISDIDRRKLNKAIKRNEWYFKKLISEILDYFDLNNISDVIMEDLQSFGKTFIKSEEFDIKYSRLVRLLRLSNIKTWLNQQAEKRGIRVHITKPHYSSQQCSNCGNIDKNNRQNQEDFVCTECGFKINADFNSSINLKNRLTLDVLKSKLHKTDLFGRLVPRIMKKEKIKEILLM